MSATPDWFGFLNVNKPAAWTSRRVVDHVKGLINPAKVGHAGTLDPLATGVLVLCLGPATRLVPYIHALRKQYRAEFLLGCRSETDDIEGEVVPLTDAPILTQEQVESALPQFVGTISQVPPAYSAVKIRGRRAYELARQGRPVRLQPRTIEIDSLRVIDFDVRRLVLDITCGSGTYIRSLGRDLAKSLGSGAVMCGLSRCRVGPFTLETAIAPREITAESLARHLRRPQRGLDGMPMITATSAMVALLRRGQRCDSPESLDATEGREVAVLTPDDELAAIAKVVGRQLQPRSVFGTDG